MLGDGFFVWQAPRSPDHFTGSFVTQWKVTASDHLRI